MAGLEYLLDSLTAVGVEAEVWVNGSFLTWKTDPGDVDVVLRVAGEFFDSATTAQQDAIARVADEHEMFKADHYCDAYLLVEHPAGHPEHAAGRLNRKYWESMWGHDRRMNPTGSRYLR